MLPEVCLDQCIIVMLSSFCLLFFSWLEVEVEFLKYIFFIIMYYMYLQTIII